jgi:class 3 adenylate cyclase
VFSLDSVYDEPHAARFNDRLASFSRLIRLDARGIGLSDPMPPGDPSSLEDAVADLLAVLDAVGSTSAYLFACDDGGMTALMAAATQPERVAGLALLHCWPRLVRTDDYPHGLPPDVLRWFGETTMQPATPAEEFLDLKLFAPKYADDPALREWWLRANARGASPSTARLLFDRRWRTDLRALLPAVQAPTVVLHRVDNQAVRIGNSHYLAEQIPRARLVELPGEEHIPWLGDVESLVVEIEELVTGTRGSAQSDRALAAVLFTDIVASTEQARRLGDREWRARLDAHDNAVRRQIARYSGEEVKTTGDGFLALFAGPAAALQTALTVRDAARQLGLEVRCGVHVGEVQRRGVDVTGIAVHIAQRVQATAAAGEVLASRTVRDLVAGSSFNFEDRGLHRLAGLDEDWQLYAVVSG